MHLTGRTDPSLAQLVSYCVTLGKRHKLFGHHVRIRVSGEIRYAQVAAEDVCTRTAYNQFHFHNFILKNKNHS